MMKEKSMKKNRLSIGQMSQLNDTTLATLRFYDKQNILSPVAVDRGTNYRYYDIRQTGLFQRVQLQKEVGLSLKQVRDILDTSDYQFTQNVYQKKMQELQQEMDALQQKQRILSELMRENDYFAHRPPVDTCTLEYFSGAAFYAKKASRNYFQEDLGSFIQGISALYKHYFQNGVSMLNRLQMFVTMKQEDFVSGAYQADQIGFWKMNTCPCEVPALHSQSSMQACIYLDDFSQLQAHLDKLRSFCRENGYQVSGDLFCQLLDTSDPEDFRQSREFIRLQVPVETENKKRE